MNYEKVNRLKKVNFWMRSLYLIVCRRRHIAICTVNDIISHIFVYNFLVFI